MIDRVGTPLLIGLAAFGVVVGSVGPWASALFITVYGTSGDGVLTLMAGLGAGAFALLMIALPQYIRWFAAGTLLCFAGSGALGVYHWMNMSDLITGSQSVVSMSWGLPALTISSGLGGLLAFLILEGTDPVAMIVKPSTPATVATVGIDCPICSSQVPVNARFCPVCQTPRSHVEAELRRAAETTGTPYEELLARARAQENRKTT